MKEYHPDPRILERFVRAVASPPEALLVVRHLLTRCPRCREIVQELAGPGWARDRARREVRSLSERKEMKE